MIVRLVVRSVSILIGHTWLHHYLRTFVASSITLTTSTRGFTFIVKSIWSRFKRLDVFGFRRTSFGTIIVMCCWSFEVMLNIFMIGSSTVRIDVRSNWSSLVLLVMNDFCNIYNYLFLDYKVEKTDAPAELTTLPAKNVKSVLPRFRSRSYQTFFFSIFFLRR